MEASETGATSPRNPPWEYDELVLALDLYFRHPRARQSKRDPAVAEVSEVLRETGRLECEVCGFDFLATYGERGRGFAECHHRLPLSNGTRATYLRDLAIVCANCHRMLHRGELISVERLRELIGRRPPSSPAGPEGRA